AASRRPPLGHAPEGLIEPACRGAPASWKATRQPDQGAQWAEARQVYAGAGFAHLWMWLLPV
ncbi:hypothetical protein ACWCRC_40460, partial [Streptomyces sp. NPDC001940]